MTTICPYGSTGGFSKESLEICLSVTLLRILILAYLIEDTQKFDSLVKVRTLLPQARKKKHVIGQYQESNP